MDTNKLYFPQEIASVIGVRKEQINYMKKLGCKFYHRKTTIAWVREFVSQQAGAKS